MKINFNNSQNNIIKYDIKNRSAQHSNKLTKPKELAQINQNQENNISRPARVINFRGSAVLSAQSLGQKFIRNKGMNSLINFVYDNEVAYNAIYSLLIAGVLKPLFVLNMPGSEEKDKQIVATKNFLQAFIGSFLGYTVGGKLIKKAVDVIQNNFKLIKLEQDDKLSLVSTEKAEKLAKEILTNKFDKENKSLGNRFKLATAEANTKEGFEKVSAFVKTLLKKPKDIEFEPNTADIKATANELLARAKEHLPIFEKNIPYVKKLLDPQSTKSLFLKKDTELTLMDAYNNCWKNSTGFITTIGKAKISSLLLPTVMAALFAKRNLEKIANSGVTLTNTNGFKEEKEKFSTYLQRLNDSANNKGDKKEVAFAGLNLDKAINGLAKGVETLSMTKAGQGLTELLSKFKKQSARAADLESAIITGYWVQNTIRSKKIDPDQKLGLNVHTVLVTIVSSACAFLIDWALDGVIKKVKNTYKEELTNIVENGNLEDVKNLLNGKKVYAKVTRQKGVENLAELITRNPNMTEEETLQNAKTIFGELNNDELARQIKKAKDFGQTAQNIKNLITQNASKDKITALIEAQGIKASGFNFEALAKNSDIGEILKNLSAGINKDIIQKTVATYGKQLSKFKSLTIFTLVVRFIVPVAMVPFSGKLKKKVLDFQKKKNESEINNSNKK